MRPTPSQFSVLFAALALSACSAPEESANNAVSEAAPDVAPSAAPNVAFRYVYRFALAPQDIAATQEKHAAACEALGLSRCRITGVAYRRSGKDAVYAELDLKLAPDIARKFGKDATALVEAARGSLSDLEIGGEDQSAAIESGSDSVAAAEAERTRLERALADGSAPPSLRAQLHEQLALQSDAARSAARDLRTARALVTATPMHMSYSTDGYMSGFRIDRTTREALNVASSLLNILLAIAIVLAALAVPLGLLFLGAAHGRLMALRLWRLLAPRALPLAE